MHIKLNNGVPETYTIGQLRKDNPNTSFPKRISDEVLAGYDVYVAFDTPKPETTELQTAVKSGYEQDSKGNWVVAWTVRDMFSDYTNEEGVVVTKAEQESAYTARKTAEAEKAVRTKRDGLLAETDFYALTDVTMTQAMTQYRQALRDITTHANFPYLEEADWPVKP
jgi:hypothetical protein